MKEFSKILEKIDFDKLMQVFSHKTKTQPVRMFAILNFEQNFFKLPIRAF